MLDNGTIAILTAVNALLDKYHISPCDVVATAGPNDDGLTVLRFEVPPQQPDAQDRFFHMLDDLGLSSNHSEVTGQESEVYALLQSALRRAPRTHGRGR